MAIFNRMGVVVVMAAVGVVGMARAQETVEDRKAVLEAQIDLLRKQSEMNKLLRDVAGSTAMGLPVVLSTSEVGGVRQARLQLANGNVGYFREGEVIQAGVVVSSISSRNVYVKVGAGKGAKAVLLDFATRAATASVPGVPGAQNQVVPNDALLPHPPVVKVPAIEVMPAARQPDAKAGK